MNRRHAALLMLVYQGATSKKSQLPVALQTVADFQLEDCLFETGYFTLSPKAVSE